MCVKDASGKWINCRTSGSRPTRAAATKRTQAASQRLVEARQALREEESHAPDSPRLHTLRTQVTKHADSVVDATFQERTTDEGFAAFEQDLAEQQARATTESDQIKADGGNWDQQYNASESVVARRMKDTHRALTKVRAEQDVATARRKEVHAGHDLGQHTQRALAEEQAKPPERQAVQDFNGNWHTSTVIGAVAVDEPWEGTEGFETAAWSRTHEVQPGIYPVRLTDKGDVTVTYDPKVTDQNMAPLLGGVPVGPGSKEDVGKDSTLHTQRYAFSMPGSYTPGLKALGGSLVLRKDVVMERKVSTGFREGSLSTLTCFTFKDEPVRLPNVENEQRKRYIPG